MKKILSAALALVLCMGLCVPALAANEYKEYELKTGLWNVTFSAAYETKETLTYEDGDMMTTEFTVINLKPDCKVTKGTCGGSRMMANEDGDYYVNDYAVFQVGDVAKEVITEDTVGVVIGGMSGDWLIKLADDKEPEETEPEETEPEETEPEEKPAKEGWSTGADGKWIYTENGKPVTNKWREDNTGWCYLDKNGKMLTKDWAKDYRGWCYLDAKGHQSFKTWAKDSKGWCYVDKTGYMVSNRWVEDSTDWCYVGADGRMLTNRWVKDSQGWCYVDGNGHLLRNANAFDSTGEHHLDATGHMTW